MKAGIGFFDKLYWRKGNDGRYHCFKRLAKADGGGFVSLCHQFTRRQSNGQSCYRPLAALRCSRCDTLEMKRRGKTESLPESAEWKAAQAKQVSGREG